MELNGAKILYTIHTNIPLLGDFKITQTLVSTWIVMALLSGLAIWLGHGLKLENVSKRQAAAEFIVTRLDQFVHDNMGCHFDQYMPLIGSIFALSIGCNLISVVGLWSPTADLNTEAAWAIVVFIIIMYYKIKTNGILAYLKGLLDQGKLGDFYQQALPVLNRELFDEDGGMTPEELENALFINNMVVKAPYQDYRLDNFSIWINGSELETKFKAYTNLSKIQTYVRENKRLRHGKEFARFCLEAEFEYIRRMMLQGAAVYRYIAGLEAEHGKFHPVRPVDTLPYWRYRETKNLAACGAEEERRRKALYERNVDELVRLRQSFRWYIENSEGVLLNIVLELHPGNRGRALERLRECGYKTDRELVEFLERTGGMDKDTRFLYSPGMLREHRKLGKGD